MTIQSDRRTERPPPIVGAKLTCFDVSGVSKVSDHVPLERAERQLQPVVEQMHHARAGDHHPAPAGLRVVVSAEQPAHVGRGHGGHSSRFRRRQLVGQRALFDRGRDRGQHAATGAAVLLGHGEQHRPRTRPGYERHFFARASHVSRYVSPSTKRIYSHGKFSMVFVIASPSDSAVSSGRRRKKPETDIYDECRFRRDGRKKKSTKIRVSVCNNSSSRSVHARTILPLTVGRRRTYHGTTRVHHHVDD